MSTRYRDIRKFDSSVGKKVFVEEKGKIVLLTWKK